MSNLLLNSLNQARKTCRTILGRFTSAQATFDSIYKNKVWAHKPGMLSGTGSYGKWADEYVTFIKEYIKQNKIYSITDVGCGDFNIGRQIAPIVERYQALDVSGEIIKTNKIRYAHLTNVTFRRCDACEESLPHADLATVRQVLQHLTNKQIEAMLKNIEKAGFKHVLVAEHLPLEDSFDRANIDMQCHGANTRFESASGVVINEPPFSRAAEPLFKISAEESELGELVVFLWRPQGA